MRWQRCEERHRLAAGRAMRSRADARLTATIGLLRQRSQHCARSDHYRSAAPWTGSSQPGQPSGQQRLHIYTPPNYDALCGFAESRPAASPGRVARRSASSLRLALRATRPACHLPSTAAAPRTENLRQRRSASSGSPLDAGRGGRSPAPPAGQCCQTSTRSVPCEGSLALLIPKYEMENLRGLARQPPCRLGMRVSSSGERPLSSQGDWRPA